MVAAWFMDESDADQRLEHQRDPPQALDLDQLKKLTGVLYWRIDADKPDSDPLLEQIRSERGYSFKDEITCSPELMENYEEKLKNFFREHLHSDEEIRLVLDGSGYFDIRDLDDNWIRIRVEKGDLIVLPAGSYHRFTLDQKVSHSRTNYSPFSSDSKMTFALISILLQNYIKAMRLFVGEPVWTPINRPADDHPARIQYLNQLRVSVQ